MNASVGSSPIARSTLASVFARAELAAHTLRGFDLGSAENEYSGHVRVETLGHS